MVWFETPSNPLLKVVDIEAVSRVVKAHNPQCLVVVDNTVCLTKMDYDIHLGGIVLFLLHSPLFKILTLYLGSQ